MSMTRRLLTAALLAALAACGSRSPAEGPPVGQDASSLSTQSGRVKRVSVSITPTTATVAAGGTVAFAATVAGTRNTAVAWSLREASGCGSITSSGLYTAPAVEAICHPVATSVAFPSVSAEATVTVTAPVAAPAPPPPPPPPPPVAVTVAPASAAVDACGTLSFSASVTGTTDGTVTWSVQEGSAGGTITPAGVYTAPSGAGTYHVVATSAASPTTTTTAVVTVSERILAVALTPATVSVATGATTQFTATVTNTCGTFPAN